jgi:hypothetical protein
LKWVFKLKTNQDGKPQRFKARLVARGFTQVAGLDYDETYSPVVRIETIRLMVSLAASMKMPIKQLDIPTAYLNGVLDKPIYTCIDGVDYRINKALYGLKQSGRLWNQRFHEFMVANGFTRCTSDGCMYIHSQKMIILLLYVDDLLVLGRDSDQVETFEQSMVDEFKAVQMGELSHILGISITKNAKGYQLSQSAYVDRILAKYGLTDCNPAAIPMNPTYTASPLPSQGQENYRGMIGSLLYLANCTRPDISAAVCKLAQRFNDYGDNELIAVKRIMRYIKKTKDLCLTYYPTNSGLFGYADSSYATCTDYKSITGYLVKFNNCLISWGSRKQQVVALSTVECEYIALTDMAKVILWVINVFTDLRLKLTLAGETQMPILFCDSQGAIIAAMNNPSSKYTRHIDVRRHFIKDKVDEGVFFINYMNTTAMLADMMTKPLAREQFENLRGKIGLQYLTSDEVDTIDGAAIHIAQEEV